ncbi:MAG: signal peptidase I [Treponema sp.]|nr:signal peptidase I [Treponema sp.]
MKRNFFLIFIIFFSLAIMIKLFVFDIIKVSGHSMEPTITNGSYVFINKLSYGIPKPFGYELIFQWKEPKKNDIIIYIYNNNMVIKRCVAEPLTPFEVSKKTGSIFVNKIEIPLTSEQYDKFKFLVEVPKNRIMAVGDNYEHSIDSRNYGFISTKNILGKVICK